MKFITQFQDIEILASTRDIFLSGRMEGGGERETPIDKILKQPLLFNLASLNDLEKELTAVNGKLTGAEQNQFQQLINLHLVRLANENADSQPSRLLFALFRNPKVSQFLSPYQRKAIEVKLSRESRDLEKLASKDVDNWSEHDAITLARSYRFVRSRLNLNNLVVDKNRQDAGDKLKLYTQNLANKSGELSAREKLFLIEVARIFPSQSDWKSIDGKTFELVKNKAFDAKQQFETTIEQSERVPAEAKGYWDVLVDEEPETQSAGVLDFLTRSAVVESLNGIASKTEATKDGVKSNRPLVLNNVEWDFLRDFSEENQTSYEFDHGSLTTQLEADTDIFESKENIHQTLEQEFNAQKTALEAKGPEAMKTDPDLTEEQKNKFDDRWLVATQIDETPVAEGAMATAEQTLWASFVEWSKASATLILAAKEEAVEAAKKEVDNAKAELSRTQEKITKAEEDLGSYKNPEEQAKGLLNQHKVQFKQRLDQGRLISGDFDFLRHLPVADQAEYLGPSGEIVLELINDTRQAITQTIQDDLGINLNGEVGEDDLLALDKFLSYEAVIKQLSATKLAGNSSEILRAYERIEGLKSLDPSQAIKAVSAQIREEVLKNITRQSVRESGAYNEFLQQYTRQHHSLEKSDRVETLLTFSRNVEKEQKEKINDQHEHAYEKVSSLFKSAEEEAILSGLNKILKTEIGAESILNNIRGFLPEGGFIHRENPGTISHLEQQIVSRLKGKVTSENDNEIHLEVVAQDLLTKLDQLQASENAKESLTNAAKQLEAKDDDNLAVSDRLELSKRTKLVQLEAVEVNENFQRDLEKIKTALEKEEDVDFLVSEFLQTFQESYAPRLDVLKNALVAECNLYFGEENQFTKDLGKELGARIDILATGVDGLRTLQQNGNLKDGDTGYTALQEAMLLRILPMFDLHGGEMAVKEGKKADSTIKNVAQTHKFVRDELGLLKPGGQEKARKNYYKKLNKYEGLVSGFKDSWEESKKRLEADLKSFNEEDFNVKYSISKSQGRKIIKDNEGRLVDAEYALNYFSGSSNSLYDGGKKNVFDLWLNDYEDPSTQPQSLNFMNAFQSFGKILGPEQEGFAEETIGFDKFIRDHKTNKGTLWFKKRYKVSIRWYSLASIWQMGKQSWEALTKKTDRKRDQMAAELGSRIWGDTFIGREFNRESNEKESERVDYWKKSYESYDIPQLKDVVDEVSNIHRKDEARAAIEKLLESGEIMLDSPVFLNLLGRLQDGVSFSQSDIDSYVSNTSLLRAKVGQAVASIWDRPTWNAWEKDFKDKYAGKMKEFNDDLAAESQTNASDDFMILALENWANGTPDNSFFRSKFEQYIFGSFESGYMNGYPGAGDRRFFYLIKGLTTINKNTGEPLLNPEALVRLNKLETKYPYLGALDDRNSYKKDGRIVGADEEGAEQRPWEKSDIAAWATYFNGISFSEAKGDRAKLATRKWLNECLAPSKDTSDRAGKINLRELDQDDTGMLPLVTNPERLLDVLTLDSGENRPVKGDKFYLNLFTSLEDNLTDSVLAMQRMLKTNPAGSDFRTQELTRFGQTLRNYFLMSQTLAGNWDNEHAVGVVTLSDAEWNLGGAEKSYDKAVEVTEMLIKNKDISRLLKGQRYDDIKVSIKKDASDIKIETAALVKKVYEDKIFTNEKSLTSFIDEYSEKNGLNL